MHNTNPVGVAWVANVLGRSVGTVHRAITRGDLEARKLDGATNPYVIERAEADRYIAAERDKLAARLAKIESAAS